MPPFFLFLQSLEMGLRRYSGRGFLSEEVQKVYFILKFVARKIAVLYLVRFFLEKLTRKRQWHPECCSAILTVKMK